MTPSSAVTGTPADDRAETGVSSEPGTPSLASLLAIWRDRDVAYAKGSRALSDVQIEAIRAFRISEVNDLEPDERARAWGCAKSWYPPQHGQGNF